jgi:tRNA A-37 threonylcarbamoyl transferase component Bud32
VKDAAEPILLAADRLALDKKGNPSPALLAASAPEWMPSLKVPPAMGQCRLCQGELPAGSRFCPACGASVLQPALQSTQLYEGGVGTEGPGTFVVDVAAAGVEPEPRFPAGTILLGRYRIINSLGKGGMGEVYRADDLRLHQQVALKFLTHELLGDPVRLARLHQEVRIARHVSHPLVCRVHDIAEVNGETFLTMEFIDGEDLGSLLKRIGRLPEDKGIQIAHQLCDGLTAVHEQGIVHRDLKPRNIMIDGRGQARLMDFGLAVATDAIPESELRSGTPAYMAPEQLAGKSPTFQTDLFALGLVLYEVFSGRRAFAARGREELARLYEDQRPSSVSDLVPGLDPRIDKVIRQCLEIEPSLRPKSAHAVAGRLPKGDPLAAAIAEGRTPSPEIVANAGAEGSLTPAVATLLLAATVLGVFIAAALAGRATISGLTPMKRSPEALAARARSILDRMGCTDLPADQRYGFSYDYDYLDYRVTADSTRQRWQALTSGEVPVIVFWFRQSSQYLIPGAMTPRLYPGRVTALDPSPALPGGASVSLDASGRLIEFVQATERQLSSSPASKDADIKQLFDEAKLDWPRATKTEPKWSPPFFASQQLAWEAPRLDRPGDPLRVEAATRGDKVVYFKVYHGPWEQPESLRVPFQGESRLFQYVFAVLFCLFVVGAALLARRNLRFGLGDATGATRLALFLFVCHITCMALVADHVPSFRDEAVWFMKALGFAGLWSGLCWLLYFAVEPYVRRRWPWRMISWNRLLAGRYRDPMVGRDILIGALLGVFLTLVHQLGVIVPPLLGQPPPAPLVTWPSSFTNVPFHLLMELPVAIRDGLQLYFLLFLLVLLVRRAWLACVCVFVVLLAYNLIQEPEFNLFWAALMGATVLATLFVALRFGLLAVTAGLFFCYFLYQVPLTLNPSAWYRWQSLIYLLWPILLASLGFLIARKRRPASPDLI